MSTDHWMDSLLYSTPQGGPRPVDHSHVLTKSPLWLGWSCQLEGCNFFKPAGEFDGVDLLKRGTCEVTV